MNRPPAAEPVVLKLEQMGFGRVSKTIYAGHIVGETFFNEAGIKIEADYQFMHNRHAPAME